MRQTITRKSHITSHKSIKIWNSKSGVLLILSEAVVEEIQIYIRSVFGSEKLSSTGFRKTFLHRCKMFDSLW